ncbi:MAG: lipid-A-disaccharide synthase [Mesorhizobium sp.]|nr:lipid-A-disaccharide synthase [Mesorhizobium sp.]
MAAPLKIGIVAGEESGDILGADLIGELEARTGRKVELCGVGGRHLEAKGLVSLFDGSEIALMGISAVVKDLPRLVRHIGQTARAIAAFEPDCVLTIDSPAFGLRVAGRIKSADPRIPIIQYVCPSVWAWAPGRAPKMKTQVDHVLCLLPFEPEELRRLDGPPGTFIGHRLTADPDIMAVVAARAARQEPAETATLMVLPGSRRSEVARLIEPFGKAIEVLRARGNQLEIVVPTLPRLEKAVREAMQDWPVQPEIVTGADQKWAAFARADAALAASGTVTLELALAGIPMVSCYKSDWMMWAARGLITAWSASLPNLIADRPIIPEYYDEYLRPQRLAREIEQLLVDSPARRAQLESLQRVRTSLSTERPAREIAADVVLAEIERQGQG